MKIKTVKKMKLFTQIFILCLTSTSLVGCAGSLNSFQKDELQSLQAKGLAVEEKSPGTGAALGILPGGGSFYTRHYGSGFGGSKPFTMASSIFWDPVNGYEGSLSINYYLTKASIGRNRKNFSLERERLKRNILPIFNFFSDNQHINRMQI